MENRINPHISYDLDVRPHHKAIANLANEYSQKGSSLLDIGCGMGHMAQLISEIAPTLKITIADIDKTVLEATNEKLEVEEAIEIEGVETLFGLGKRYDIIIMSHVLEHTLQPADIIRGVVDKLLSKNGHLILAVPNVGRLEIGIFHFMKRNYVNKGHVYGWDRPHWMNFLENILGLDVVKYEPDYFPIPKLKKIKILMPMLVQLARVFPWQSYSNIAVIKQSNGRI